MERIPRRWNITRDYSIGEITNYVKWAAIVACMVGAWALRRKSILLSLAIVFTVILADDMLLLHERLGHVAQAAFAFHDQYGLRPLDFGEMVVWLGLGLLIVATLMVGFLQTDAGYRRIGYSMIAILALLIACGIIADMLSIMVWREFVGSRLKTAVLLILHVLEDGGEMVVGSVACAYAAGVLSAARDPDRARAKNAEAMAMSRGSA